MLHQLNQSGTPQNSPFKANNSVTLISFTVVGTHHLYLIPEHFVPPKKNPVPKKHSFPVSPCP